ncbi:MAG: response regulator transcription factor [Acidobacteriota bacterium]|nr:response regulator transcription factor [Acidobacteriota bacterium]
MVPSLVEKGALSEDDGVIDSPAVTARILVIEDDPNVGEVVARYLTREGFLVEVATDGVSGLQAALASPPDLLVLDLMLPGLSGVEVLRRLRLAAPVPVIMLTARSSEADRVNGLEFGADDYVAKPFSPRELTARVKAVLRRAGGRVDAPSEPAVLVGGPLELSTASRQASLDGRPLDLTVKEFDLLAHLMSHPGRAFRREELMEQVWGFSYGDTSTVTVHVSRLREKVEADPGSPRLVRTVRGIGYRFEP